MAPGISWWNGRAGSKIALPSRLETAQSRLFRPAAGSMAADRYAAQGRYAQTRKPPPRRARASPL